MTKIHKIKKMKIHVYEYIEFIEQTVAGNILHRDRKQKYFSGPKKSMALMTRDDSSPLPPSLHLGLAVHQTSKCRHAQS